MSKLAKYFFVGLVACLLVSTCAHALDIQAASTEEILARVKANRGQVTVINVFASWCPPCRREAPDMVRFSNYAKEHGIAFLGVSVDESRQDLANFLEEFGATFPVCQNDGGFLFYCESAAVPQILVFDKKGALAFHEVGRMSFDDLLKIIEPYTR